MKKASWHMPGGLFHAPMFRGTQKNRPPRFRLTHDARILPASMSSRPDHGCRLAEPVLPVSSTGCSCATTVNPMLHSPGRCKPRKCRKPASGGGSRPSEKAGETPDPPADSFRLAAARLSRRARNAVRSARTGDSYSAANFSRWTLRASACSSQLANPAC